MTYWIDIRVPLEKVETDLLIKELFNRIGDFTYDPEPKHDPILEKHIPEQLREDLYNSLFSIDRFWYERERADMISENKGL